MWDAVRDGVQHGGGGWEDGGCCISEKFWGKLQLCSVLVSLCLRV